MEVDEGLPVRGSDRPNLDRVPVGENSVGLPLRGIGGDHVVRISFGHETS
jgi:hypothetical protein